MSDETTRALLVRIKDLLVRDGWRRGAGGPETPDVEGPRCLLGGLYAASAPGPVAKFDHEDYYSAWKALSDLMPMVKGDAGGPDYHMGIAVWNDMIAEGATAVLAVIDRAIAAVAYPVRPRFDHFLKEAT